MHREHERIMRKPSPGLPIEHLVPGCVVVVSRSLQTGDRSYSHDLFEVTGTAGDCIQLKALDGFWKNRGPVRLMFYEYEFYGADHLLPDPTTEQP